MTHDIWIDRLSEYVDGTFTGPETAACEAHLARCAECRAIAGDLRAVAARAASLPDGTPGRDLWPGIARAIGHTPRVIPLRRASWLVTLPRLAAAAALVAVLSGGSVWLLMRRGPTTAPPTLATAPAPTTRPAGVLPAAARTERAYDAAVADLQAVLAAGRGKLDSTTIRVLERNLATIDSAVVDAQRAVAQDPNNAYLNAYLARTMRRKLDLLRQAALLASAET